MSAKSKFKIGELVRDLMTEQSVTVTDLYKEGKRTIYRVSPIQKISHDKLFYTIRLASELKSLTPLEIILYHA
jgi:hypothetical protein